MKKQCSNCREYKDLDKFYLVRKGDPLRQSECIPCRKEMDQGQTAAGLAIKEYRRRYSRAKGRALRRLSHAMPDLFNVILQEELKREQIDPLSIKKRKAEEL